jgi:hypothetical protein
MQPQGQTFLQTPPASFAGEISAAALLAELAEHGSKMLVFTYEGRDVQAGYHVTEVKTAAFQALDCGANYESWHETFIQLWDIPPNDQRGFMPVSKFLAIIGKVAEKVPLDTKAKVTFEVSDGQRAMALYRASGIEAGDDAIRVALTQRPASCKPRDRWLETSEVSKSCCGPKQGVRLAAASST